MAKISNYSSHLFLQQKMKIREAKWLIYNEKKNWLEKNEYFKNEGSYGVVCVPL